MDILYFYIAYIIFVILSIALHELGHLICGLLSGYKFGTYKLFGFVWIVEDGKVRLKRDKNKLMAGQCLMFPPEDESNFKYVLYNLGGGFVNLLFGVIFIAVIIFVHMNDTIFFICLAGATANIYMAATNLIPMAFDLPNDGMNVWMASRTKAGKHGLYCIFKFNQLLMEGMRYRDMNINDFIFIVGDDAVKSNFMDMYPIFCQAAYYYDRGELEKSIACYDHIDLKSMQKYYRNSAYIDYLYYYIICTHDYDKAKEIYNHKGIKKLLNIPVPTYMRILAAYEYYVLDNHEKSRELLGKAKIALQNHENKGIAIMEQSYIIELEELMAM